MFFGDDFRGGAVDEAGVGEFLFAALQVFFVFVDFLGEARLDWAGFFRYSAEDGTDASTMDNQVPPELIGERMRYVQEIQDEITAAKNISVVGRTLEILVDQVEDGQPVGRSYREAPEIDGLILLDGGEPGEWVTATISGA